MFVDRGDVRCFEQIVASSQGLVRAIAWRIVQNAADVDDVAQEVFARVHAGLPLLRDERALAGWIASIARHTAIDCARARARRAAASFDDDTGGVGARVSGLADERPAADEVAVSAEERARLREAMTHLSHGQRDVIALHAEGAKAAQIAQALGVAVGTVESRLHRARCVLRERMGFASTWR